MKGWIYGGGTMIYCDNCQRNQTDYCYRCKHGYYGSEDKERNRRYDLSEFYKPKESEEK
jgi:hypothetical protein